MGRTTQGTCAVKERERSQVGRAGFHGDKNPTQHFSSIRMSLFPHFHRNGAGAQLGLRTSLYFN